MSSIKYLLVMLFSIAVVACGGGGGSSSPAPTYSISGTVSGNATSGVTINLSGASTATTTTATGGTYSFTGLANGSYTVTPSLTGNSFNPTSTAVTVSGANVTGKNFTATAAAATYSISGSAGIAGATITLSGANTGSVTAGTGGAYTISGLLAGSYTVTPSLSGYTFAPTSASVTITNANATATTFVPTAIPVPHSISGTVSPSLSGVTITVTGTANATATSGTGGAYTVTGLYNGSYTLTPSKTGYTFNPVSLSSVAVSGADVSGQNFTGTANSAVQAAVSGAVSGSWKQGVTLTVSGGASGTQSSNASGNYSFTLASGQTYTLTPLLSGYTFSPTSVNVTVPPGSSTAITGNNFVSSPAVASNSISGTLSYAGAKTGGITVRVFNSGCTSQANCQILGATHLASQSGSFSGLAYTIRGLQLGNNSYVVKAGMGTSGTGYPNAWNSGGSVSITTAGSNYPGANITIADKAAPTPVALTGLNVAPGNGGALVVYNPPVDTNGSEIATSYLLTWGTGTNGTGSGSHIFKAQGTNQNVFLLGDPNAINADGTTVASTALANGTAYYFSITPYVGTTPGTAYVTPVAYTIGAVTGGHTVTGTVGYTGTATGPMYIAVHDQGGGGSFAAYGQVIASPSNGGYYSVTGVPAGTWYVAAIIDQNHDGEIDPGDISNANGNGNGPAISLSGTGGTSTQNLTLPSANATVTIGTDHQYDSTNTPTDNYSVNQFLNDGMKHIVAVTLFSGPNVAVPFDMGDGQGQGNFNNYDYIGAPVPSTSDVYQFMVTYSDGTSEVLSGSPTGVLNSFATGLTVTPATGNGTPTLSWTAPTGSGVPTSYLYSVNVYGNTGSWYYPSNSNGMPSTQTSVVYNTDGSGPALSVGTSTTYTFQVSVKDANGYNTATATSHFTP